MSTPSVLDAMVDPEQGWTYPDVPVERHKAVDGNPFLVMTVDGRKVIVAEKSEWASGAKSVASPHRLVATIAFTGLASIDLKALLSANLGTHGLPAWGMDEDGDLTLSASFPIGPDLAIDHIRRQLLVCVGLIAEAANELLESVEREDEVQPRASAKKGPKNPAKKPAKKAKVDDSSWETAGKVASVAGTFIGALFGIRKG